MIFFHASRWLIFDAAGFSGWSADVLHHSLAIVKDLIRVGTKTYRQVGFQSGGVAGVAGEPSAVRRGIGAA